jgi:hypothetical protein
VLIETRQNAQENDRHLRKSFAKKYTAPIFSPHEHRNKYNKRERVENTPGK